MKKATQGWPSCCAIAALSMHLLDAGEQPAARAVGRLDEVPDFGKVARRVARRFAYPAGKSHAHPMAAALGSDVRQLGLEPLDVGLLARSAALRHLARHLFEKLIGREIADRFEVTLIVRKLQLDE